MKLRSAFIFACLSLAISISGCLPVSAATRHIVLLFDERVELPGLSLLEAELALLWQILAIDRRNWIPESDFQ
jgi:hypothetical protein